MSIAADSSACSLATFTVNTAADATTSLSQCSVIDGSVEVSSSIGTVLDLSGPEKINGDLSLESLPLISLMSSSLTTVSGASTLHNLTALSSLSFTSLTSVGSIQWDTLPALSELPFDSGVTSAETVSIDDTLLSSLAGLELIQVNDLTLSNNRRLQSVGLPLRNLTGRLTISANGLPLRISFPDLVAVNNLAISNVSPLELPSLQTITGTAQFDTNYFSSIQAPDLTACGGSLSLINNPDLINISLPQLSSINGQLSIANNSELEKITRDLSSLKTVEGNVYIVGEKLYT